MRFFALSVLCVLAAGLRAQEPVAPDLSLKPARYDAGIVDQGQAFRGSFRLHNDTRGALRVLGLDFGCPCAKGEIARRVLAAGTSAEIPFEFETRGLEGKLAKTLIVRVMDEDGKRREIRARIEVEVRSRWTLSPPRWDFGTVAPGSELRRRFDIHQRPAARTKKGPESAGEGRDQTAKPGPAALSLTVRDERLRLLRDEGGRVIAVELILRAPGLPGRFRGTATVYADDPQCPARILRYEGEVAGDIMVQPRELRFGQVPRGRGARRLLTLTSRSGRPFRIVSVKGRDVLDVADWSPKPARRHTLDIRLPKTVAPGAGRGTLLIAIEGEERPLPVPFRYGVRGS